MDIVLLFLLFLVVISKSIQNLLNKNSSTSSSIIATSLSVRIIPSILCIPFIIFYTNNYIPDYDILLLTVLVGFIIGISTVFLVKSYNTGQVSTVTPFYSLTPFFGGIFSWIILGQEISISGFLGILMICVGSYIIKVDNFSGFYDPIYRIKEDKSVLYIILYTILIGFVSPIDSFGVSQMSPFLWLFYIYLFSSITIFLVYFIKGEISYNIQRYNSKTYFTLFSIGFFTFVQVASIFFSYQRTKVVYVLSIFMMSIVVTSILGFLLHNDNIYLNKILAIILMTSGSIFLILTGF